MEINFEIRNIFLLLLFLSVRIYYSIKLLSLYSSMYVLNIVELQLSGIVGLLIILIVSVRIINVFIRIVFRVSLELLSYKIIIYLFILGFLILRVLTKLNFK
jgi:hypothetical protein